MWIGRRICVGRVKSDGMVVWRVGGRLRGWYTCTCVLTFILEEYVLVWSSGMGI
jgi:hypothetical protein